MKKTTKVVTRTKRTTEPTKFSPQVRSRHNTHDTIRGKLGMYPKRVIVRLGSTTPNATAYPKANGRPIVEINPVEGVKNSANKLRMKTCFTRAGIQTAPWYVVNNAGNGWKKVIGCDDNGGLIYMATQGIEFPVVTKHIFGSRGTGNKYHEDQQSLTHWMQGKNLANYILEEYFTGVREYRLHICKNGCFYTCRKMLKEGTPQKERWYRNDENSVWIVETNPNFDKPVNWDTIVADCVKALAAVGLDVAAFDVRVQSTKNGKGQNRPDPKYIILESNSAPSFGTITTQKYLGVLPQLITDKL
jgi:glutathione synthase/RimK-type ligase-like ATP-grasp enzyme